jgi:putative CocE/NonD family hydrolase
LRGTGCSGGTFDFFQPAEAADGYEAVEWLAAQPWSSSRVAMIGKSYPGITQLFVAEAQPPHLVAITPGHFFGDAYRDIAFPGGIFNDGFASLWSFVAQPAPGFQSSPGEIAKGDQTCAANRKQLATNLRTNPFVQAQEHPYDDLLIAERSPLTRLDRIKVPVYAALSWQDEQLMSRQTHLLTALQKQGTTYRAVLGNGDHGVYRRAPQLAEMDRFLEAHVQQRATLTDGTARAAYLAEPPVSVFWEQNTGQPRWRTTLPAWGDQATPQRLYLGADSTLVAAKPAAGSTGSDMYVHSAAGSQGIGNPKWGTLPADVDMWDKYSPPAGAALAYTTAPFASDTLLLGPASADLWITATAPNVDFQVTVTEVRPDGKEQYVAQGWLRGSQRFLDRVASTELLPVQTHQQADVRSFSPTEPSLARVEVFPFGHAVRAGSKLRVWIEAPTALPQLESFLLDPKPAAVTVWRDGAHPSSLVLPVLAGATIPATAKAFPACGAVLRQPCRTNPRP